MKKEVSTGFQAGAEAGQEPVPGSAYTAVGRCVLAAAKALQGSRPGEFRDPEMQADFERWKNERYGKGVTG